MGLVGSGDMRGVAVLPMRKNRDFMVLWSAQAVSQFGTSMSVLVFPLIGYAVSGSTREAGLATTGVLLGEVLALLPAGVVVDRTSRRSVLIVANVVAAAAFTVLAVTALTHVRSIWLLLVMGVVSGAASSLVEPANAAATRIVVPKEQLPEALAQSMARSEAARIAGPPAGGALYSIARGLPFVVDAVSYLFAAAMVTRVRHPLPAPQQTTPVKQPIVRSLFSGLRFMAAAPVLRAMMTCAAFSNFATAYLSVVITLRLVRAGVAPAAIGAVDTIAAVAGLAGAVIAPALVRRARTGLFTVATGLICSAALFFTAFSTNFIVVGVLGAAAAVLFPANNAGISAYMSSIVPDGKQGRLHTAMGFVANGVAPLAPALAGILLAGIGGLQATLIGSLLGAVAVAPLLINTQTRTLGRPSTWQQTPAVT